MYINVASVETKYLWMYLENPTIKEGLMSGYVYRFVDESNNIIYVGKTKNLKNRMNGHFTRGHLPLECYSSVAKIEYLKFENETIARMEEVKYINMYRPRYNKSDVFRDTIKDQHQPKWKTYDCVWVKGKRISISPKQHIAVAIYQVVLFGSVIYYMGKNLL
jgi:predicted GIY-YIG superfamily endonuclease